MVKVSNGRWSIALDRELDRVQVTNLVTITHSFTTSVTFELQRV